MKALYYWKIKVKGGIEYGGGPACPNCFAVLHKLGSSCPNCEYDGNGVFYEHAIEYWKEYWEKKNEAALLLQLFLFILYF